MCEPPESTITQEPKPEPQSLSRWQRLKGWLVRVGQALRPGPLVSKGVVLGALSMAVLQLVFFATQIKTGFGLVPDLFVNSLLWLLGVALCGLVFALLVRIIQGLPRFLSWKGIIVIFGTIGAAIASGPYSLLWVLPFVIVAVVLGGAATAAFAGGLRAAGPIKRVVIGLVLVVSVAVLVYLIWFLVDLGNDDHLVEGWENPPEVQAFAAPDPAQPGPYKVLSLTYGSGSDQRRPEYGEGVKLTTDAVDGTPFLKGSEGWQVDLRHWYWGFDFESLPINGRVWYPDGEGPFPLVLIVHGNHDMQDFSDPGYGYLGELLASRGVIFVSVDENFLNGGLRDESDCRGWMLLKHLQVWRSWSLEPENLFHGRVDLDSIALIGHSRGGEAAAIAGAFNRLPYYPDDATVEFDFGFNIRGIVAIAPADGQYNPADRPTPLEDVSYLVLQGAHDADCSYFMGSRQLRRVRFSEGSKHFKASIYSYRANHGQFNTVWGDDDFGWPGGLFLNRQPLLDGQQQRRISKVYISAFVEAVLNGNLAYVDLFRDHRAIKDWLPDDLYITRFADAGFKAICDYEEDVNVATASKEPATIASAGLAVWREQHLDFRQSGSKRNSVVYLGWGKDEEAEQPGENQAPIEDIPATYSVSLPDGLAAEWELTEKSLLVFAMADADEEIPEPDDEDEDDQDEDGSDDEGDEHGEDEKPEPIDLTIELQTSDGTVARLALSSVRLIPPAFKSRFTKLPDEGFAYGSGGEPTLQSFELPLARFVEAAGGFDPAAIQEIRFVFDRTPEAVIIVDDIGFAVGTSRDTASEDLS